MDERIELQERPKAKELYMIAGWSQWADAGEISSALPEYLVELTDAQKIGTLRGDDFYIFQIPGTHHVLRPRVKLKDGHRQWLRSPKNELYYAGDEERGLLIFRGEEPHRNAEHYADALLDIAEELGVKRVAVLAGVYGAVPYDRDRQVSCVYSLDSMREDLARYAVRFSNYEGGASIGTLLADRAEERGIEFVAFYALVPYYDLTELSTDFAAIKIERDLKAWYDLLLRLNHMFQLELDLDDLEAQSEALVKWIDTQIRQLERDSPELKVSEYIASLTEGFEETPFEPLSDLWERELRNLFDE
jgi:predicted ATP-grasp superfamily ATP-dependent carboligase